MGNYEKDIIKLAAYRIYETPPPEGFNVSYISRKHGKSYGQVREDLNAAIERGAPLDNEVASGQGGEGT